MIDELAEIANMQQRYYDPAVGRFLSVDPVTASSVNGGNFNRYWYANNNPYKFTDPDGRLACIGSFPKAECIQPPPRPKHWGDGGPADVQLDEGPSHEPRDEDSSSAFFDGEHVSRATDDEYLSRFPDLAKQREAIIKANVKMTILAVTGVSLEDAAIRGGAAYAVGEGNKIQGRIDALDAHARKRGGMYKSERSARRLMQSSQTSARHWAKGFRYLGVLGFIGGMGSTVISEYEGIVTEELERAD